jgi:hypothetical protein
VPCHQFLTVGGSDLIDPSPFVGSVCPGKSMDVVENSWQAVEKRKVYDSYYKDY